ncbi:hypothetical protein MHU86_25532 [Fragilaria crotonensis]|nr:hypothetical protein MHU86_25532 [Fragilaria crotonensis]
MPMGVHPRGSHGSQHPSKPTSEDSDVTEVQPRSHSNDATPATEDDDVSPDGYQLNALRGSFPESSDDFDLCFEPIDLQSCANIDTTVPFFESICDEGTLLEVSSEIPAVDLRVSYSVGYPKRMTPTRARSMHMPTTVLWRVQRATLPPLLVSCPCKVEHQGSPL